jgi:hypothetical protein
MGHQLLDQYSLLHFAVGVISYFWNVPFWLALFVHTVFEWAENTVFGVWAINHYIIEPGWFSWPGGKHRPDALVNIVGDTAAFTAGWGSAAWLDIEGMRRRWYSESMIRT